MGSHAQREESSLALSGGLQISKAEWCSSAFPGEIMFQATENVSGQPGTSSALGGDKGRGTIGLELGLCLERKMPKSETQNLWGRHSNSGRGRNLDLFIYMPLALKGWPVKGKLTGREEISSSRGTPRFFPAYVAHRVVQRPAHNIPIFALNLASWLEGGTGYMGLVAVAREVATMFMKALRDFV